MTRDTPSIHSYRPEDAGLTVEALTYLRTPAGESLRRAVGELKDPAHPAVSEVARLRRGHPAEALHAALTLAAVQGKARLKFPEMAFVWTPPEALEQASGSAVAAYKASQFRVGGAPVYDLCAGMGGDAFALADIAPTTAVELSPQRALCLRFNAESRGTRFPLEILTADVRSVLNDIPREALVHIDPARRWTEDAPRKPAKTRRSACYEDLIPGPLFLDSLFSRVSGGCIKLSPAVDFDTLPVGPDCRLELISHHRTVVQALLWRGRLAQQSSPAVRTATLISAGRAPWSFHAAAATPEVTSLLEQPGGGSGYFYELDGCLTRSQLAAAFCNVKHMHPLTSDGGYAHSPSLMAESPESVAVTAFAIRAVVSYSESRVAKALQTLGGPPGVVEVKSRGHLPQVDTDELQVRWTKAAPHARTVLVFRSEKEVWAVIADRVPRPA